MMAVATAMETTNITVWERRPSAKGQMDMLVSRDGESMEVAKTPDTMESLDDGGPTKASIWRTLWQYRVALFWSAFIGLSSISWGYDVLVSLSAVQMREDAQ